MSYYITVKTLSELLGDDGILRLPPYLPKVFVLDEVRKKAIDTAVSLIKQGKNVLIEGSPGTGKTALMFMVLSELSKEYKIGYIKEGVSSIGNEHLDEGMILFYDDLPRIRGEALLSIFKNKVKGLITTARSEEIDAISRTYGVNIFELFNAVRVQKLENVNVKEMLLRYLNMEGIRVIDKDSVNVVVNKAQGLPVYIWQVVRELKIKRQNLTKDFARSIPRGMLDYVDNILWRLLGGKTERYEVLLTLLTMTDFVKYSVHQDLYNYIYMVAKEKRLKRKLHIEDILLDTVIEDVSRYLAREGSTYSFRLPHDSWADVLRGKSNGPMAPEISKMNIIYNQERRKQLILEAATRAWQETVKDSNDITRVKSFRNLISINFGEKILNDIIGGKIPIGIIETKEEEKRLIETPVPSGEMSEKQRYLNEIKKLIRIGDTRKIRKLLKRITKYNLTPSELNLVGVAYLTIWEETGKEKYFDKGIKYLEMSGTKEAEKNILIAYKKKDTESKKKKKISLRGLLRLLLHMGHRHF